MRISYRIPTTKYIHYDIELSNIFKDHYCGEVKTWWAWARL